VAGQARIRWADLIHPYMQNVEAYLSPGLRPEELAYMNKPFAHTAPGGVETQGVTRYYGGYGYNYQYLGNTRNPGGVMPFHASDTSIAAPANTVALGDTKGARKGSPSLPYGADGSGVYVIDPPLGSQVLGSTGSRKSSASPGAGNAYYEGGDDGSDGPPRDSLRPQWRSCQHHDGGRARRSDDPGTVGWRQRSRGRG